MSAAGHHGFKVWDLAHNEFLTQNPHVAAAAVGVSVVTLASLAYAVTAPRLKAATVRDEELVPSASFNVRNLIEMVGEFVTGFAKDIIGKHYGDYLPLLMFIFIWTLINNLLGSVPGFGSATDNLNTTMGMGLVVFLYYNFMGFKSHGFHYLEQFTGHLHGALLLLLGPVMFVIETISHMVRPMTLGIRLRSNIYADHTVYGIISGLLQSAGQALGEKFGVVGAAFGHVVASLGPVPIVILGLLVALIQAFVFTLLTTIYIGMATAHDDH